MENQTNLPSNAGTEVLLFISGSTIYVKDADDCIKEIVTRGDHDSASHRLKSLCIHEGKLYDAGHTGVYETLTGTQVSAYQYAGKLISFHGKLYAADISEMGIYDIAAGKVARDTEHNWIHTCVLYQNRLYGTNGNDGIFRVFGAKPIAKGTGITSDITDLCVHQNRLYFCVSSVGEVRDAFAAELHQQKWWDVWKEPEKARVFEARPPVEHLYSDGETLFGTNNNEIFDILRDKHVSPDPIKLGLTHLGKLTDENHQHAYMGHVSSANGVLYCSAGIEYGRGNVDRREDDDMAFLMDARTYKILWEARGRHRHIWQMLAVPRQMLVSAGVLD
jgi:hypothetical protein